VPRFLNLIAAGVALGCAASCAAILGFEHLSEEGGITFDAGQDATDDGAIQSDALSPDAGTGACGEIGIAAEPIDAAVGGGPPVLVALKVLDFGVDQDGGAGSIPGFNLDKVCSVDLASSTCETKVLESTFERHAQDKSATGIDNAGYSLIKYISGFSSLITAESINGGIAAGKYGAVVRITDWNGQPDDDDLQVEVFPAIGLLPRADPDGGFNANDQWILDSRFEVAPNVIASSVKSDRAWVSGGTLVARLSEIYFPILIDQDPKPFDLHLHDVIIQGTLVTANGATVLTAGTVAGRWKTDEFLGQVRTIFVKDGNGLHNTVLCEPVAIAQLLYGGVKKEVCDARDIRSDSDDTHNLPCDAFSAAMRIDSYSVTNLGAFDASAPIAPRCQDAAIPVGDDCTPN
jgi:hypothetical protein